MERRYLLPRAALAVLALVAATTVVLPSDGFTWAVWWGAWAIVPTLVIGNLTAAMAIVITIAMALRADAFRRAWNLGVGLCAAVTAWGIWTSPWLSADPVGAVILPAAWLIAAIAVGNFYVVFPQRPSPETWRDHFYRLRRRELDRALGYAQAVGINGGIHDPVAYFDVPVNWMSGVTARIVGKERYRNWVLRSVERERNRLERDMASDRHRRVLTRVGAVMIRPWPALGVLVAAVILLTGFTTGGHEIIVVMMPAAFMITLGMMTAREQYLALEDRDDRTRVLWLLQALVIGFLCVSLWVPALVISALMDSPLRLGLAPIILASGALAFVSCLAVAVFRFGALDPALVMRRSIVLGAIVLLLTLVFAAVEAFVSGLLTGWLNLPDNSGAYAASATATLVFGPLWKRLSGWADRVVDRILPEQSGVRFMRESKES